MSDRVPQDGKLSRRDALKLFTGGALGALAAAYLPPGVDTVNASGEEGSQKEPHLKVENLPTWAKEIWDKKPRLEFGENGILQVERIGKEVPSLPTFINRRNINHLLKYGSRQFMFDKPPVGIVLHTAANTADWNRKYARGGTAREFAHILGIEESGNSAAFVIGDAKLDLNSDLNAPPAVIQTEVPYEGVWAESAHALIPSWDTAGGARHNVHLQILGIMTDSFRMVKTGTEKGAFYNYRDAAVLQHIAYEARRVDNEGLTNRRTLGIEVLGTDFHRESGYPSPQKTANLLAVMVAIGKKYEISGLGIIGHYETDPAERGDPGVEFLYQMRILCGLAPLIMKDRVLMNAIYKPFETAELKVDTFLDYIDFHTKILQKTLTAKDRDFNEIMDRLQIGAIKKAITDAEYPNQSPGRIR